MFHTKTKYSDSLVNWSSCFSTGFCKKIQSLTSLPKLINVRRSWRGYGSFITITAVIIILIYSPILIYLQDMLGFQQDISASLCHNCTKLKFKFTTDEENACKVTDDIFLLIIVPSKLGNGEARSAIRKTWGSVTQYEGLQVRTKFLLGASENNTITKQIHSEQKLHHDIIQVDLTEGFNKLTEKSIAAFTWAAKYCPQAQFVMKTDDNSFNYIDRFIRFLREENSKNMSRSYIAGSFMAVAPERRLSSKYYVPHERYPDWYYPMFCLGPVYMMSNSAVKKILAAIPNVQYIFLEDVYVTGLARVAAGVRYTHVPGILPTTALKQVSDCAHATWVKTSHPESPTEMMAMWNKSLSLSEATVCQTFYGYILNISCVIMIILILVWSYRRLTGKRTLWSNH